MDVDLRALRAAAAVADRRSFSDAALDLHVSQQAVSKRVSKLEADLGVTLFVRTQGDVAPTTVGAKFLVHARAAISSTDAAIATTSLRSPLRVAVHGTQIADANLMQFYLEQRPDSHVELVVSSPTRTSREVVVSRQVDAGFARSHWPKRPLPEGIRSRPAYLDALHLLVARTHHLAQKPTVSASDLAGLTMWVPGAGFDSEVADYYQQLAQRFAVTIDTDRSSGAINFNAIVSRIAASPTLASFGGAGTTTPWNPDIVAVPIVNPTPAYPMSLLWNKDVDNHPELMALSQFVAERTQFAAADVWTPDPL